MVKQRISTFVTETAVKVVEIDCPDKEASEILIHHVLDLKHNIIFSITFEEKRLDQIPENNFVVIVTTRTCTFRVGNIFTHVHLSVRLQTGPHVTTTHDAIG